MRGIFPRLLLSFLLTSLLAGLLSGLVMHSFSRNSVESFRHQFRQQLHANMARSTVLMGQAAYMMREHWGDQALEDYTRDIEASMRTRLYLVLDGKVLPHYPRPDASISLLANQATTAGAQPVVVEEDGILKVMQRLQTPDGASYVVIGLHQLGPPPGPGGPPQPPPPRGPGFGMPPPPDERGFLAFIDWLLGYRAFIFFPLAGIFCFFLARSFSAPLNRLRRASRQIAGGDLTARIGTSLGKPGNEIGDLGRDFDLMAERMERMVNEQRRLLLDISHELRSPLTRLRLSLELAKRRCPDDGNLARIGREAERIPR